ncbi:MAG: alkaline phosphatase [Ideonella sp.]|nr:alkaline phosphatase [Ideonella sp.]
MNQQPALLALAVSMALALPALAAPPVVQGPESVQDWVTQGQQFIAQGKALKPIQTPAKNVILFVGDGMGISTLTAARILEGQLQGKPGEENRLSFETFPYLALSKTYTWDQQTSDSAPTMAAMVTGVKTREGMLSVTHETARGECNAAKLTQTTVPTLLELAAAKGKATGIVSTARITHATPAANYAHTPMRDWESDANLPAGCEVKDIARQLIEVSPTVRQSLRVVLGGGRTNFLPKTNAAGPVQDPEYPKLQGRRLDGRDLTQEWLTSRGPQARYVWNKAQFESIDLGGKVQNDPLVLGLFEPSRLQYEADRVQDPAGEPSLTEMTRKAIQLLARQRKGYFLQIEAGRIDHAHHAGNAARALRDTIELSNAVRAAMAMTNERETLIIVTADHSHTFTVAGYPHRGNDILGLVRDVPEVDGQAPALSKDANGLPYTTLGYANGPGSRKGGRPDLSGVNTADLNFLQEATVPLSSETHGGEEVAVYARGPRAHFVRGSMEQHWIFHVMRHAFGF